MSDTRKYTKDSFTTKESMEKGNELKYQLL